MRKTLDVTITEDGRDKGKVFLLTEMSAMKAEKWAARALLIAVQSGADIGNVRAGMAGVAVMGISAVLGVKFGDVEPLLDEMLTCVQIKEPAITRAFTEDDIEEVMTIIKLREEVLTLHLGFSTADALSAWMKRAGETTSSTTPMSPPSLEQ